jgi:hypothetical protein
MRTHPAYLRPVAPQQRNRDFLHEKYATPWVRAQGNLVLFPTLDPRIQPGTVGSAAAISIQ